MKPQNLIGVLASIIILCLYSVPASAGEAVSAEPKSFASEHRITAAGKTIDYTAIAGETILQNASGEPVAAMWSTSYVMKNAKKERRPVTFLFNGGPGSSSSALHIGLAGPKILSLPGAPEEDDGAAPFAAINNSETLLASSDLVFIDPVGTGFSRAIGEAENVDFYSMSADTASIAKFIQLWITKNKRWNSPKYLAGVSYGTTRAVSVANSLLNSSESMAMNGLVLLSPALDFSGSASVDGNLIGYFSYMPTMAATAHYHGKAGVGKTLEAFAEEARQFNLEEYIPALILGEQMSADDKREVAERLSYFIGLDTEFLLRSNLKVIIPRFRKELLRSDGLTAGYGDGRYTANEYDKAASEGQMPDPAGFKESSAYAAVLNSYFAEELGVEMDRPYKIWNTNVGKNWDWTPNVSSYADPQRYRIAKRLGGIEVSTILGSTMRKNEQMDVFASASYYDMYTPFFDTERTFAMNGIVHDRVTIKYYKSGHRPWRDEKSRIDLNRDIRDFYRSNSK